MSSNMSADPPLPRVASLPALADRHEEKGGIACKQEDELEEGEILGTLDVRMDKPVHSANIECQKVSIAANVRKSIV